MILILNINCSSPMLSDLAQGSFQGESCILHYHDLCLTVSPFTDDEYCSDRILKKYTLWPYPSRVHRFISRLLGLAAWIKYTMHMCQSIMGPVLPFIMLPYKKFPTFQEHLWTDFKSQCISDPMSILKWMKKFRKKNWLFDSKSTRQEHKVY